MQAATGDASDRYRSVVENAKGVLFQTDEKGLATFLNPAWEELTGLAVPASLGKDLLERVHPDDRERAAALLLALLRGEAGHCHFEARCLRADGRERWVELWARPLRDASGRVVGASGALTDVTERREVEARLRRRDAIMEAVADASTALLSERDWRASMPRILAALGQATGVSRAYLFENRRNAEGKVATYQLEEWTAPGVKPEIDNPALQGFVWTDNGFERWEATLGRGQILHGPVRDFAAAEQDFLREQGIRSLVIVPIVVRGEWWGLMGFDDCASERAWSVAEVDALKTAAGVLAAAVDRMRAEEALHEHHLTRQLVRRMLQDISGKGRIPAGVMREMGKSLAAGVKAERPEGYTRAFESMGLGILRVTSIEGRRHVFEGQDLLELNPGTSQPTCQLALGFVEAAVERLCGGTGLGAEVRCQSQGHDTCRFVVMSR